MDAAQLLSVQDSLNAHLALFHPFLGRSPQREALAVYARGRLGPLERKSLEPIALAEGASPRVLQLFLERRLWDEEGVLDTHQRLVAHRLGDPEGIFIADETSDAKKGGHTAGVARQYCGESGKIDNCIVSVHWAYAGRDNSQVLLDGSLYLPPSWDASAGEEALARRAEAGVPEDAKHQSHCTMSIEQLRRARQNGVPGRWATGDEHYGGSWDWREQVAAMALFYVAEVPKTLRGYRRAPAFHIPRRRGRGRKPRRPIPDIKSMTVEKIARLTQALFEPWRVHEGTKGPEVWNIARVPLWASNERHPGQTQAGLLLIADNVLTGERKYFFSNAPARTPTSELLRVAFSRWRVERCFQDAKGELGLNHAETRSWQSTKRHLILTCVLHLFMTLLRSEWGGKHGGSDTEPGRRRSGGDAPDPVRLGGIPRQTARNRRTPRAAHETVCGAQPQGGTLSQEEAPA